MQTFHLTSPHGEQFTGTLREITNQLLDEFHATRQDGPGEEFYPHDYWSAPGCFLLDEGEVPPAKPEYTIGTVTTLAARTWDVHKGEIQISEGE